MGGLDKTVSTRILLTIHLLVVKCCRAVRTSSGPIFGEVRVSWGNQDIDLETIHDLQETVGDLAKVQHNVISSLGRMIFRNSPVYYALVRVLYSPAIHQPRVTDISLERSTNRS